MKLDPRPAGVRPLLFAMLLGSVAAAQAASGFMVTAAQQATVKVGMSRDEVRALLGRPAHNVKFRAEPGRTWTYGVASDALPNQESVFDVDFSADGRVVSTGRRIEQMF